MSNYRFKTSQWRNAFLLTRVTVLSGAISVCVGLGSPGLYQVKFIGFIAIATVAINVMAIGMALWQLELRSRRLRDRRFWLSLVLNLIIGIAVSWLYFRSLKLPSYQEQEKFLPTPA